MAEAAFRFEKLEVWKRSVAYGDLVYEVTERFPAKERFGLISQLSRAAVSISGNIAEGSSRASNKDFSRFVEIAFGSLCETISHLYMSRRRKMISDEEFTRLYDAAVELSRMLSVFRNSLGKWKPDSADGT